MKTIQLGSGIYTTAYKVYVDLGNGYWLIELTKGLFNLNHAYISDRFFLVKEPI